MPLNPEKHPCEHSKEGWCLDCVAGLVKEIQFRKRNTNSYIRSAVGFYRPTIERLSNETRSLRDELQTKDGELKEAETRGSDWFNAVMEITEEVVDIYQEEDVTPNPATCIIAAIRRLKSREKNLFDFARSLLSPEEFGHAVTGEIRDRARVAIGIRPCES